MSQGTLLPTPRARVSGWIGIGLIGLLYTTLYVCNFRFPLTYGSYTYRIWTWSRIALTVTALVVLVIKWRLITLERSLIGVVLAIISASSRWYSQMNAPSLLDVALEGGSVWLCFMGAALLFKELEPTNVTAFQSPLKKVGLNILFGLVVAIPLAIVNNLYFYLTSHSVQFQSVFHSAVKALSAGIGEEIVFRFFVLAICLTLLKSSSRPRLATATAVILAVVPHRLNHLPDLFLSNPSQGIVLFLAASLLFGLPMALLQIKKSLETAIAFHWFVDFARFIFGF